MTFVWVAGVFGCVKFAGDWSMGIVPEGPRRFAALAVGGVTALLALVIPVLFLNVQRWQRARGDRPITLVAYLCGLTLFTLTGSVLIWVITRS